MKFLELKTENQLPSYPLFAKEGKPQGRGVLKRGLGGVKQLLAPCLLLLATLFAALPAWAAAKTEDVENKSGSRFEGGLDASKIYAGHRFETAGWMDLLMMFFLLSKINGPAYG